MSDPNEINYVNTRTQTQREKYDHGQREGISGTNDNCYRDGIYKYSIWLNFTKRQNIKCQFH